MVGISLASTGDSLFICIHAFLFLIMLGFYYAVIGCLLYDLTTFTVTQKKEEKINKMAIWLLLFKKFLVKDFWLLSTMCSCVLLSCLDDLGVGPSN